MIVALLNQNGVRKTTLAIHLVREWSPRGKLVTLIDADTQGSALERSHHGRRAGSLRLFGTIGLVRDTQHREAPELARCVDHSIINEPPRGAGLIRLALLATELIVMVHPRTRLRHWPTRSTVWALRGRAISERSSRSGFASGPVDPDPWIKMADALPAESKAAAVSAKLTIDMPINQRGMTVGEILRELLARQFPLAQGDQR
jgi:hypothetical protein